MNKIIIFGLGDIAGLAHFYFSHDSDYEVVAFTVDQDYLDKDEFNDIPVVSFEDVVKHYHPSEYDLFVALSYSKMNTVRKNKCQAAKEKGYRLPSYVSSKATTFRDFQCGENCFILEDNTIQPFVKIGNNVTLWSGNHIGHHSVIEDNVFITSHVVVSGGVIVGENSFIGVNSTLRDHIKMGNDTLIGAGSLVLKDTEPFGVYMGNPAEKSKVPSNRLRRI
jgi:sugar O-acyltransferase (sialic acid O-acetyltransferase NeuD family)